jgi:hypothetical protein
MFAEGAPVALVTARNLWRCQTCVLEQFPEAQVDWAAVDASRARQEAQRAGIPTLVTKPGNAKAPVLSGFTSLAGTAAGGLKPLLRETAGVRWLRPSKPKPHATVAHIPDPKARAVND